MTGMSWYLNVEAKIELIFDNTEDQTGDTNEDSAYIGFYFSGIAGFDGGV
jgi:hypothetical protein